jgi:hypothetical protein
VVQAAKTHHRPHLREGFELLELHPEGMLSRAARGNRGINRSFHPKTVNGCVWKLVQKYPDKVYKPSRGLFRLMKYRPAEDDRPN